MVGLKTVTFAKISPKMVNPRDLAGNAEEEEEYRSSSEGSWNSFVLFCFCFVFFVCVCVCFCWGFFCLFVLVWFFVIHFDWVEA